MIYTQPAFWLGAFERAIRTVAQAALAVLGTGAIGILDVDWMSVASIALLAGLASILTSIATPNQVAVQAYTPKHAKPPVG